MPVEAGPAPGIAFGTLTLTTTPDSGDIGQTIRLTASILDPSQTPIDPATCTLTVNLPDGTTVPLVIGTLTRTSAGVYFYDYVTTLAGAHTVTAVTTIPNAAGDTAFTITGSPSPVSLDYVKAHLNISPADQTNDVELTGVIASAVALAEDMIGPILVRTITEVHQGGTSGIALNAYPVVAVTSVTTSAGFTFSSTFTPGGYCYLLSGGTVQLFGAYTSPWDWVTVAYTAGRPNLPANILLGIAELVKHLWQPQSGSRVNLNQEDWSPDKAYAVPNRVRELFGRAIIPGIG